MALHGNTAKHVHIVTEQRLMRGFDYRAPGVGFGLLLTRVLDSKRAFRQAIGRAGRMGDGGVWTKLPSVGLGYPLHGDPANAEKLRHLAS